MKMNYKVAVAYAFCLVSDYEYDYGCQHSVVLFEYIDLFCYAQMLTFLLDFLLTITVFCCFIITWYGVSNNAAVDYFRLINRHGNTALIHALIIAKILLLKGQCVGIEAI